MKLTKYAHACALITKDDQNLLIDPGILTTLPETMPTINVLVITHDHPDHFDEAKVQDIIKANPNIVIYGPAEVASKITEPHVTIPETDKDYTAGPFTLRFYGGQHAVIHKSKPVIGNFGVCIDGAIYYPGDSFAPGPQEIAILLAPAGAPWMKISEGIDFIATQRARIVIPTHDEVLSEAGKMFHDGHLEAAAREAGGEYRRLQPGDSIEV